MIRKEGKARWTYTCEPCEVRLTHPDQFRAIEACHRHERGFGHFGRAIGDAVRTAVEPLMTAFGFVAQAQAKYDDLIVREIWRNGR